MELLALFCTLAAIAGTICSSPEVSLDQGLLRGKQANFGGIRVNQYLGVPYAEPPIAGNRFQPPEELKKFRGGQFNATKLPNSCYQSIDYAFNNFSGVQMWNPNTEVSEDCLYLNVWVPNNDRGKPFAVMVWIYGGGFTTGSSTLELYDGTLTAARESVIVVSMQYRVGAFGFLYLGDGVAGAGGNMGLMDQQMAIKWVHTNIDRFGGDKNKITLFGESAGAGSVGLQLLSPTSRQYFQNAIMQSGSPLAYWAGEDPYQASQRGKRLAKSVGCMADDDDNMNKVARCLLTKPADELLVGIIWPTIDGTFLTKAPIELMKETDFGQRKVIIGLNKDEGSYFTVYSYPDVFQLNMTRNISSAEFEAIVAHRANTTDPSVVKTVAFEYEQAYEHSDSLGTNDLVDDVIGDHMFVSPVMQFANMYVEKGHTAYVYRFVRRSSANPWPAWMGVMHGYEIEYVFGVPRDPAKESKYDRNFLSSESRLSADMMALWCTFARTGDPSLGAGSSHTPWPAYTLEDRQHLVLDIGTMKVEKGLRDRKVAFWNDLVPFLYENARPENGTNSTCGAMSLSGSSMGHLGPLVASFACVLLQVVLGLLS